MQRIAIFGATSAIAGHCARLWAARGDHLALVGRNPDKLAALAADLRVRAAPGQTIHTFQADLDRIDDHEALLNRIEATLGPLDVILVAHGTLPDQQRCQNSVTETLNAIHTNALSPVSLLTLAANRFEARGRGTLAAIASVAGDRGRQSNYVYGCAKGMLDLFLQGLRNRLAKKGVAVVTIKPGFVDTPMTAAFPKGPLWAKPETIARGIVQAIDRRRDEVYLPWFWYWIMGVLRHIPERLFKRLSL
ncbi:decaprenylphospho-beta-D-erythro-pentofuranosid-2-ulose 2-reductase [Methylomarinovum caldicuralii]|uniref:Decaprenylphospho-beta-D-erythro-pentofuranosid-2-ulose 2-reductase n=1 Tax=Methylomarinovum caldicuralii TaxID=438856 RepID=A0AAU9C645_9GAMM|nr:SDR family oxidoreductase [Methylomarinovum caldicuralii]BCX80916.1 decaprenylphospho-beta-D-erythro-pentofuranosid-2-ulose 2-reductase [Methylomarinovum caldicuralii]